MNENSLKTPSTSAAHHGLTAEAISRRAYELWEQEGRPEGRDLHHWLRAEQQLIAERQGGASSAETSANRPATDQPLQSTRSGAAGATQRPPTKRGSASPFSTEQRTPAAKSTQPGTRRG